MKLSKMTKQWLVAYISFKVELSGAETKEELLRIAKSVGIPEKISPSMYQGGCWRMECD